MTVLIRCQINTAETQVMQIDIKPSKNKIEVWLLNAKPPGMELLLGEKKKEKV